MRLIIGSLTVSKHGHDIRKHNPRPVILVRVKKEAQAFKLVLRTKDGTLLSSVLGHPHGKAITKQVSLTVDGEFDFNLPVCGCEGHARVDPAGLRGAVRGEADVFVGANDGVAAEIPPSALEIRVEVGLDEGMRAELWLMRRKCQDGKWLC
jgi:hypothetical protein